MIGPTDLLRLSPSKHFKSFQVFLIYFTEHVEDIIIIIIIKPLYLT